MIKWIENLWNLKSIFDKYLPMVRELVDKAQAHRVYITTLIDRYDQLKKEIEFLKSQNKEENSETAEKE